jgi:hypothetical protein
MFSFTVHLHTVEEIILKAGFHPAIGQVVSARTFLPLHFSRAAAALLPPSLVPQGCKKNELITLGSYFGGTLADAPPWVLPWSYFLFTPCSFACHILQQPQELAATRSKTAPIRRLVRLLQDYEAYSFCHLILS